MSKECNNYKTETVPRYARPPWLVRTWTCTISYHEAVRNVWGDSGVASEDGNLRAWSLRLNVLYTIRFMYTGTDRLCRDICIEANVFLSSDAVPQVYQHQFTVIRSGKECYSMRMIPLFAATPSVKLRQDRERYPTRSLRGNSETPIPITESMKATYK